MRMNCGTPIHDMSKGARTAPIGMSRMLLPLASTGMIRRVSFLATSLSRWV
jgi:hypothetical protein